MGFCYPPKYDKLAAKLKANPLEIYYPDFEGGDNLDEATAYITNRFCVFKPT